MYTIHSQLESQDNAKSYLAGKAFLSRLSKFSNTILATSNDLVESAVVVSDWKFAVSHGISRLNASVLPLKISKTSDRFIYDQATGNLFFDTGF
ncbi:hypothetical protein CLI64_03790 [Nostoc sp. CENA543]|uniref:hypothetical protein n=1 Tax=Nostoc sp. CENA543 TaxID=1869241 RepID=UPI000CA1D21C|nr:hypothetical protein [Nostoc sp. CENA543]AUS99579.1 hypothetical protein CLI64_03790 [Nostoc sp. CENA543]